nr:hypothetical protein [uncultured Carboxylicivirga sp.]
MRLNLILALFIFSTIHINAQTKLNGIIVGEDNQPAAAVSVMLLNPEADNNIITYAFTDDKGLFNMSYTTLVDSVTLSCRSLNYNDTTLIIANKTQEIHIMLPTEVKAIKEVNVHGTPIVSKQDTTTYMVGSFEKQSDESIGDVIKRMPGFTVEASGKIYYMGKPIDKYYIEGMDLLEGRYGIANKNLSNKAVGSVEVLHNHQPIKMLRDKVFNDGTSLNLKLKKKYTTTFRAEGAIGIPFPRYSANITPMLFSPKHQMIATLQANNIGNDLSTQHHPFTISYNEIDNYTNTKPNLLDISSVTPPGISNRERYLMNNAALISFNYLTKLSDEEELKTNLSYYNDRIEEEALIETEYYLENDTTRLREHTENTFKKNSLITDLIYTNNASKKYVNNKFRLENYWDKAEASINERQQLQNANLPHFSAADELDWHRMVGKHFISFKAFVDYNHSPQQMQYQPGVFDNYINNGESYNQATQHYLKQDLRTKASAAFTLTHKRWAFSTKAFVNFSLNKLNTTIDNNGFGITADSLRNKLNWTESEAGVDEKISYETPSLKLRFNLPFSYVNNNIDDAYHHAGQQIQQTIFAPRAYLNYEFCNFFKLITSASYSKSLGDINGLTQGFIINNYRSLNRGLNQLPHKYRYMGSIRTEFKNPLSGWFASVDYRYSLNHSDIITRQISMGNGVFQSEILPYDNEKSDHTINGEITYYIANWRSTIGINSTNSFQQSQYVLNQSLSDREMLTNMAGLNINWGYWRALQIKYRFNYTQTRQQTTQANSKFYNYAQVLDFFFYLTKKQWINIRGEYNLNENNQQTFENWFGDFSYAFKPTKGKFSYKIKCRNVFDTKQLVSYWNSDISLVRNTYYLRPREILLNVSYRF